MTSRHEPVPQAETPQLYDRMRSQEGPSVERSPEVSKKCRKQYEKKIIFQTE